MTSNTRALFLTCALALLAGPSDSQEQLGDYRKAHSPPGRVHYDLATGTVTKLVRPRRAQAKGPTGRPQTTSPRGAMRPFRNTLDTGYFTTLAPGTEFIDWATKNTGGRLLTSIVFGYGTIARDLSAGGPGVSLDLAFYNGTGGGNGICTLGQETTRLSFTGLPGVGPTIPPNFGVTYVVSATLATPGLLPDGPVGWGYSDPLSSANMTGPIMTDFGTNTGWLDSFQWWSAIPAPTGTCVGTFWFGGCSSGNVPPAGSGGTPCASFYMELCDTTLSQTATCTTRNPGLNPNNLSWVALPVLCEKFEARTVNPVALYAISSQTLAGHPLSGLVNGDLLIHPAGFYGSVKIIRNGVIENRVPCDLGLIGTNVHVQAAELAGPGNLQLTNALDCIIGG